MRVTNTVARVLAAGAGLLLASAGLAQSPGYPDRPVKVIVPFAAAGPTDVVARLITQKLSEKYGQQFYIENVAGAGGNLGMATAGRSPPDGYTILFVSSSYTVNPSLYAKAPYDPDRDFAPVTKAAGSPNGLFVHPSIPAKSVKELVDLLRANPGKYTFASPGIGTTPHLSSELFKLTFALDFALAPFPGGGPSIQSVVGGHTPMCFQAIPPATPLVKDGCALAITAAACPRSTSRHQEPGSRDHGRAGPAGTPQPIIDLLAAEIARIVRMADAGQDARDRPRPAACRRRSSPPASRPTSPSGRKSSAMRRSQIGGYGGHRGPLGRLGRKFSGLPRVARLRCREPPHGSTVIRPRGLGAVVPAHRIRRLALFGSALRARPARQRRRPAGGFEAGAAPGPSVSPASRRRCPHCWEADEGRARRRI
jgi:tripartite-type tricarboxylate transporter receptor subunit TctC